MFDEGTSLQVCATLEIKSFTVDGDNNALIGSVLTYSMRNYFLVSPHRRINLVFTEQHIVFEP